MLSFKYFLTASFIFLCVNAIAKPVIYDTDMAIDDWLALLYLDIHPDADLKAVTISASGETRCQEGIDNARQLLQLVSKVITPVACGDEYPQDGYLIFPHEWQKDANTLSGIDLRQWIATPTKNIALTTHAVERIHQVFTQSNEPITIIAVGPMTNIAQWLEKYPDDKSKLDRLVIMGGSYQAKGNIIVPGFTDNHPNQVSEWNFFIDPIATRTTLEANINKVMVGLDVTNTVRITHPFADHFKTRVSNPASQFTDQVFDKNRWFIDSGEYYFWDVMAAIVAMNPELCVGEDLAVSALAEVAGSTPYLGSSDLTMPALNDFGRPRTHIMAATAGQVIDKAKVAPTKVCMQTNADKVFAEFIKVLTSH